MPCSAQKNYRNNICMYKSMASTDAAEDYAPLPMSAYAAPTPPVGRGGCSRCVRTTCTYRSSELTFIGVDTSRVYCVFWSDSERWACALAVFRIFLGSGVIATSAWAWSGPKTARESLGLRMVELTSWGLLMTAIFFLSAGVAYVAARVKLGSGRGRLIATPAPVYNESAVPVASSAGSYTYVESIPQAVAVAPSISGSGTRTMAPQAPPPHPVRLTADSAPPEEQLGGAAWLRDRDRVSGMMRPPPESRFEKLEDGWRRFVIVSWEVAFAFQFIITLGFWAAGPAFEPSFSTGAFASETSAQIGSTVFQHAVFALLLMDACVNFIPAYLAHYAYLFIIIVCYLFANIMYTLIDTPVYSAITWKNALSYYGLIIALVFLFAGLVLAKAAFVSKVWCLKRQWQRRLRAGASRSTTGMAPGGPQDVGSDRDGSIAMPYAPGTRSYGTTSAGPTAIEYA